MLRLRWYWKKMYAIFCSKQLSKSSSLEIINGNRVFLIAVSCVRGKFLWIRDWFMLNDKNITNHSKRLPIVTKIGTYLCFRISTDFKYFQNFWIFFDHVMAIIRFEMGFYMLIVKYWCFFRDVFSKFSRFLIVSSDRVSQEVSTKNIWKFSVLQFLRYSSIL